MIRKFVEQIIKGSREPRKRDEKEIGRVKFVMVYMQGNYVIKVTLEPLEKVSLKEVWHFTFYCTNAQLEKYELNIIDVLHVHTNVELRQQSIC